MSMDNIKLFAKIKKKELLTLIHAIRLYSQDTGMKFTIEKCAMLAMKNSKRHLKNRIELTNQGKIRTPREKET